MTNPLVSIIIPVHNRAALLRESVACCLSQTWRAVEVLVVDDGSTDDTTRVADELAAAHPGIVRAFHTGNRGPGAARELARQNARGEFIQLLDSDDWLAPRKIEACVAALEAHPDAGVAYCATTFRDAAGSVAPLKRTAESHATLFPLLLHERWWGTVSPLYRSTVFHAAGPWLPLWLEEDWEFDARIGAAGTRLVHVQEVLAEQRDRGDARLSAAARWDARRLGSRATAHALIWSHAKRAQVAPADAGRFGREMFLVARQCARAGLADNAAECLDIARECAPPGSSLARRLSVFSAAGSVLGRRTVGVIACDVLDPLRDAIRGGVRA